MEILEGCELKSIHLLSREDQFTYRAFKLLKCLINFLRKETKIAREIPVMGMPFDQGIVVLGIIDELRYDPNTHELIISEYKTRMNPYLPTGDLLQSHRMQVMLYKTILDDLIRGNFDKSAVAAQMHLDADKELCSDLLEVMYSKSCTFGTVCDLMVDVCQRFKPVVKLEIEYHLQSDNQLLGIVDVDYDEMGLGNTSVWLMSVWKGERKAGGVSKRGFKRCKQCMYAPRCGWRLKTAHLSNNTSLEETEQNQHDIRELQQQRIDHRNNQLDDIKNILSSFTNNRNIAKIDDRRASKQEQDGEANSDIVEQVNGDDDKVGHEQIYEDGSNLSRRYLAYSNNNYSPYNNGTSSYSQLLKISDSRRNEQQRHNEMTAKQHRNNGNVNRQHEKRNGKTVERLQYEQARDKGNWRNQCHKINDW